MNLVRVKCIDETGGKWAEKVGNDEIKLAGVGIDATGKTVKIPGFSVYPHFDDQETKTFSPPMTIATLDVPSTGVFPKSCNVTLILAETDAGSGLSKFAQEAFSEVTKEMKEMKDGMTKPEEDPTFKDKLIKKAKEIAYGWIKEKIGKIVGDDVFDPQVASVEISSSDFYWGDGTKLSPEIHAEFHGHNGAYRVTYYWEIRTVASARG